MALSTLVLPSVRLKFSSCSFSLVEALRLPGERRRRDREGGARGGPLDPNCPPYPNVQSCKMNHCVASHLVKVGVPATALPYSNNCLWNLRLLLLSWGISFAELVMGTQVWQNTFETRKVLWILRCGPKLVILQRNRNPHHRDFYLN